jgi:hypothetical protein
LSGACPRPSPPGCGHPVPKGYPIALSWLIHSRLFPGNLAIGAFLFLRRHALGRYISGMTPVRAVNPSSWQRSLGPAALALTCAATNFSAFTVLGLSGAGYAEGYLLSPDGPRHGLMALSFFVYRHAHARGSFQPAASSPKPIHRRALCLPALGKLSPWLSWPSPAILSIQAMSCGEDAGGHRWAALRWGALIVTAAIWPTPSWAGCDRWFGTMSSRGFSSWPSAWPPCPHSRGRGRLEALARLFDKESPLHYRLPGPNGAIGPLVLAGFFLLWFLADPCFPDSGSASSRCQGIRPLHFAASSIPCLLRPLPLHYLHRRLGRAVLPGLEQSASDFSCHSLGTLLSSLAGSPPRPGWHSAPHVHHGSQIAQPLFYDR